MNSDEKKWVKLAKQGDKNAMSKLYEMYYKPVFNTAYRLLNDFHFAEDVMHEAFIKAFEKIQSFEERSSFGSWVKRIVINESLQWLKKYGNLYSEAEDYRMERHLNNQMEPDTENDFGFLERVEVQNVLEALKKLKDNYRTIINLYYMEGYDYREISQIMGISYQHARTMLSRAKRALKKLLTDN